MNAGAWVRRWAACAGLAVGAAGWVACGSGDRPLVVMTRNVYIGADVDRVLAAETPAAFATRVEEALAMLDALDFADRAERLADEVARHRPHLIGLQEITRVRTQRPGDAVTGGSIPAETPVVDFLEVLLERLAARQLRYRVVAQVENTDVEVPRGREPFDDVRLTDYDVILARHDLAVTDAAGARYRASLAQPSPTGDTIRLQRGWAAVSISWRGRALRFVNTHLETLDLDPRVQPAQGEELLATLADVDRGVIVVGDLNAATDGPSAGTYRRLAAAGFVDAWSRSPTPEADGFTCCHALDLRGPAGALRERIDHVLLRVPGTWTAEVSIVGAEPEDRTAAGLWPSDHAGVVARVWFRPTRGR